MRAVDHQSAAQRNARRHQSLIVLVSPSAAHHFSLLNERVCKDRGRNGDRSLSPVAYAAMTIADYKIQALSANMLARRKVGNVRTAKRPELVTLRKVLSAWQRTQVHTNLVVIRTAEHIRCCCCMPCKSIAHLSISSRSDCLCSSGSSSESSSESSSSLRFCLFFRDDFTSPPMSNAARFSAVKENDTCHSVARTLLRITPQIQCIGSTTSAHLDLIASRTRAVHVETPPCHSRRRDPGGA